MAAAAVLRRQHDSAIVSDAAVDSAATTPASSPRSSALHRELERSSHCKLPPLGAGDEARSPASHHRGRQHSTARKLRTSEEQLHAEFYSASPVTSARNLLHEANARFGEPTFASHSASPGAQRRRRTAPAPDDGILFSPHKAEHSAHFKRSSLRRPVARLPPLQGALEAAAEMREGAQHDERGCHSADRSVSPPCILDVPAHAGENGDASPEVLKGRVKKYRQRMQVYKSEVARLQSVVSRLEALPGASEILQDKGQTLV